TGTGRGSPQAAGVAASTPISNTFSFVPDSGISAAAFSPSWTLGTVTLTSVIGNPWVGAMVLTPSRSIRRSSRSQYTFISANLVQNNARSANVDDTSGKSSEIASSATRPQWPSS